ncbi:MAG: hypothetical protein K8R59_11765 [Thermoanaerobaculales bacterium]|nr:hypothetical protein [Thermoanaerobaculales bacterium]
MAHRVNVMLDDRAWEVIRSLPRGRRSRFVSRAVVDAHVLDERRAAVERLTELRAEMPAPPASAEEMVRELRDTL